MEAKDKRFIEESFPVKRVSEMAIKEKNFRQGNISTLHIWWARRPLASSRATSYAALVPTTKDPDEWNKRTEFIVELSKWENSLSRYIIGKARKEIIDSNGGRPPRILDPFAGGGSIPLEASRLGCETHAIDYNPVATLILKCTLEYPLKYGKTIKLKEQTNLFEQTEKERNVLVEDVKKWGDWIFHEAKKEIGKFYPKDNESVQIGYIWARTITCQNPSCGAEIPLIHQYWLAKKKAKKVSLYPYVDGKTVHFKIVGDGYEKMPEGFDPERGSISRAVAVCPVCGSTIDNKTTRKLFQEGKAGQRMIAVVMNKHGEQGKKYRLATQEDIDTFKQAEKYLEEKRRKLMNEWGIDPVPDEPTPNGKGSGAERAFSIRNYGLNNYGDLFNSRQKLALITFAEKIRLAHQKMLEEGYDRDYAKALVGYLGLTLDTSTAFTNTLTRWNNTSEAIVKLYSRQVLPIIWDFVESNPFSGFTGGFESGQKYCIDVLSHVSNIGTLEKGGPTPNVIQSSATELPYPNEYFDAIFTDPPYYDNVPYSYLSDFFYVCLKRSIGEFYPELFVTPLTPKSKEIVAYSQKEGGFEAGKSYFEDMLKKSFQEMYRVLKPNGIAVIVYAHKTTSGWETVINSLLDSGLVVTASWPIDTEMKTRLRAQESAALASSVYFVCRKMERTEIGWLPRVREEIKNKISEKLKMLWEEGIGGADYFISAIGSAIEVFGKYKQVMDYEGNVVTASDLLDYVRETVTEYAIKQILHDDVVSVLSPLTRFYILWRWTYGESKVEFDDAKKIAQSTGLDLEKEWSKGLIKKEKDFIAVIGPHERKVQDLEGSSEMIDVMHRVLIYWKDGMKGEMVKLLTESGYGTNNTFYKVAQAISETLSNESKEKKILQGFLSDRDSLVDEVRKYGKGGLFV